MNFKTLKLVLKYLANKDNAAIIVNPIDFLEMFPNDGICGERVRWFDWNTHQEIVDIGIRGNFLGQIILEDNNVCLGNCIPLNNNQLDKYLMSRLKSVGK